MNRGKEALMSVILAGSPKKGGKFLFAKLSAYPDVRDDVMQAREKLCQINRQGTLGKTLLTVFDLMASGYNLTYIGQILGTSRQYVEQIHKKLIKLPALEQLRKNLGGKSDDE